MSLTQLLSHFDFRFKFLKIIEIENRSPPSNQRWVESLTPRISDEESRRLRGYSLFGKFWRLPHRFMSTFNLFQATAGLDGAVILYDFESDYSINTRCYIQVCFNPTLIKKKIKCFSYIRKFRREQLQSHIWGRASQYMRKCANLWGGRSYIYHIWLCNFSHLKFLIYCMRKIFFSFLISVVNKLEPMKHY